jgi:hypothetical protein
VSLCDFVTSDLTWEGFDFNGFSEHMIPDVAGIVPFHRVRPPLLLGSKMLMDVDGGSTLLLKMVLGCLCRKYQNVFRATA